MQRIVCKKCGHPKIVSNNWFEPPDFDDEDGIWTQEHICPKCNTVHEIECEYTLEFDILDVKVEGEDEV